MSKKEEMHLKNAVEEDHACSSKVDSHDSVNTFFQFGLWSNHCITIDRQPRS